MNGRTHVVLGVTIGVGLAYLHQLQPLEALLMAYAGGTAALIPDIDHYNSTISHRARPARIIFMWFSHRGLTHSLLMNLGVMLLATLLLPLPYAQAVYLGYASHILADMCTVGGVRLLYPLPRFWYMPVTIHTGGLVEWVLGCLVGMVCLYLLGLQLGVIEWIQSQAWGI